MTPLSFTILMLGVSAMAGVLGALLGLGGGIIVVPALTLLFGIDIHYAIGASLIGVLATSSGSAATYVRKHVANIRLAMLLEVATTAGAIIGAWLAGRVAGRWLYLCFGLVLLYAAVMMWRGRHHDRRPPVVPPDPLADRLQLHGSYHDPAENRTVNYRVARTRHGLVVSHFAGMVSGLLGVGGGIMKVPLMSLAMGMPIKAATATSNFMIGVTAAASAGVYFTRGQIDPFIVAPVAVGVLLGARGGARLAGHLRGDLIRKVFLVVMLYVAMQMLLRGWRG